MRHLLPALVLALLTTAPLTAADSPKGCSFCGGIVSDLQSRPAQPVSMLVRVDGSRLGPAAAFLASLSPEEKARTVLTIDVTGDLATVDAAEKTVASLLDSLASLGPFGTVGVSLGNAAPEVAAYAIKRLAVNLQGRALASKIAFLPSSVGELEKLHAAGANAYFDLIIVRREALEATVAWLASNDPVKRVIAIVPPAAPNHLFDLASAWRAGASSAYLDQPNTSDDVAAIAVLNREMTGDFAPDAGADVATLDAKGVKLPAVAVLFVRGEDLRTVIVPEGNAAASTILSIPDDAFTSSRRVDAQRDVKITDTGRRAQRFLIGLPPTRSSFLVTVDRPPAGANVTKETIDVATRRGISVEEIIRNHQSYWAFQSTVMPRYVARNETKLRFGVSQGGETVEATIAGPHFFDRKGTNDWVWQDFYLNGVKWKHGAIPEIPIIQPEKVTQLPLDIHLTNDYHYTLVGETRLRGYDVYEVRFEPPPNAPEGLPLYRGTVWIDQKHWARIAISMIQLHLSGEVLSNEERVDYLPFDAATGAVLTAAEVSERSGKSILWLPLNVNAQQVLSTAGRSTVVLRETNFSNVQLDPRDYDDQLKTAYASPARMVRDTAQGLRYLENKGGGERVVKEGFDTSRMFLVGGIHHDEGLQYPVVPLGGIDYFNYDLQKRGLQTNVFFAGLLATANLTNPHLFGTRTNFGADFFGIAIPTENSIYRDGKESTGEKVKTLPTNLSFRLGHPVFGFGKIDLSLSFFHTIYSRADDTAPDFIIPKSGFEIQPGIDARYDRWGYSLAGYYEHGTRTNWKPWGNLAEYSDAQKSYSDFGVSLGKSFYLPKFQRLAFELDWISGSTLDRFSRYDVGYFGPDRIRGIKAGSLQVERGTIGHASYGLVFSEQFRLETFYDYGLLTDRASGMRREPFEGVGIAGSTMGPWGTLLRLDLGKSVGPNAQSGVVANVVFLKLFGK
jgi:hypothetical protein